MPPGADDIQPAPPRGHQSGYWPTFQESRGVESTQELRPTVAPAVQPPNNVVQGGLWPPPTAATTTNNMTAPPPVAAMEDTHAVKKKSMFPLAMSMGATGTGRAFVAPFRGSRGASSFRRDIYYASLRNFLTNFHAGRSLGYISPTHEVVARASKANSHVLESINLGDGARGHWLYRSSSKYVLLFFHGGGYIQYMSSGHAKYLFALQRKINRLGFELSIFVLEYQVAPFRQYPGQLSQAVSALKYLIDRQGRRPKHILIGGDSAGGNLTAALLLHLANPHPSVPAYSLEAPLRGALLISPVVSWDVSSPSFKKNRYSDILTSKALQTASDAFIGNGRQHDAYSEPCRAPVEWWQRVAGIVDEIMIWGGGAEVMIDGIREFAVRVEIGFERAFQQHEVLAQPQPISEGSETEGNSEKEAQIRENYEKSEVYHTAPAFPDGKQGFKFEFEPEGHDAPPLPEPTLPHVFDYEPDDRRQRLADDLAPNSAYDKTHEPVEPPPDNRKSVDFLHPMPHPSIVHVEKKDDLPPNDMNDPHKMHAINYGTDDQRQLLADDLAPNSTYDKTHQPVQPPPDHRRSLGPEGMLSDHLTAPLSHHVTISPNEDIHMIDAIIEEAEEEAAAERAAETSSLSSDYGDRNTMHAVSTNTHLSPTTHGAPHSAANARHSFGIRPLSHASAIGNIHHPQPHSHHTRNRSTAEREESDYLHTAPTTSLPQKIQIYGQEWPQQDPRRRVKYVETPRMCHEEMIVDYILRIGGKREGARSIERWIEGLLGPDLKRESMRVVYPGEEERKRYLKGEVIPGNHIKVKPVVPPPPPPPPPTS